MRDKNYWKKKYKPKMSKAKIREEDTARLLGELTGRKLIKSGFGTETDEFIPGSAENHGYEKGEADYFFENTNIHIEITGPLVDTVPFDEPLWLRPDKIENARLHLEERETWVVHRIWLTNAIRVFKLDETFFRNYDKKKYKIVNPIINGQQETYAAIPADDECVQSRDVLVDRIKHLKK